MVSVVPSLCVASVVQHSCVSAAAVSCCRSVLRDRPCAEPFSWSFRDSAASVISCVTQCSVFFASLLRQCCVILLPHSVQRLSFEFSVGLQSMGRSLLLQVASVCVLLLRLSFDNSHAVQRFFSVNASVLCHRPASLSAASFV